MSKMKKKILVVEKKERDRNVLEKILCDIYDVKFTDDGRDAIEILKSKEFQPDAMVLNLNLSGMSGCQVLKIMGDYGMLPDIPVLAISDKFGDETELEALALSAADYMPKPYHPQALRRRLANLIQLQKIKELVKLLERDETTGLYNKVAFCDKAESMLEAHPDKSFDLLAIDIEHFQLFNESYGYIEGDHLLKYISDTLRRILDGKNAICAREYGDRFLIMQERRPSYYEDFHDSLVSNIEKYPLDIKVHLKFGIYQLNENDEDINVACDRAISAVKRDKTKFGEDTSYYDDSAIAQLYLEQQITDDMIDALKNGEFQVYLQPKYDLFNEKIAGAEALVRWIHPKKGIIPPCDFIPIFEKNGFITELDMYVWERTCALLEEWIKRENKYVPVSVNVSRKDIYKENLVEILQNMLKKYGLKPKHLHLEITESAYTENPDQLIKVVTELKQAGFTIEMDDFGSGYSSLNMLAKLPIDVLKLDIKIIQSYGEKNSSRSIINFIMGLARWMNLYVVAEGVETQQQIDLLKSMDCNYVQGYYYAKPMPDKDFEDKLSRSDLSLMPSAEDDGSNNTIMVRDYDKDQIMLIIDDLAMNRAILTEYFRDKFSIVEATNGDAALGYFRKGGKADIIILDIYMPHVDGFQVLEVLKSNALVKDIPVIVSSQADDATIIRAIKAGASDFMTKPFTKEDAVMCVNRVFSEVRKSKREDEEIRSRMTIMEKLATTDYLTGLWNRVQLEKLINRYLEEHPENRCNLIIVNVDNFKQINDTLGHMKGDEVLQMIAEKLLYCFREDDIVGRLEGDTFAVLMKAELEKDELQRRMDGFHKAMRFEIEGIKLTCSSGACRYPDSADDFELLYKKADKAMYMAKRNSRGQCVISD